MNETFPRPAHRERPPESWWLVPLFALLMIVLIPLGLWDDWKRRNGQ